MGFEPTVVLTRTIVFKTITINRSDTLPNVCHVIENRTRINTLWEYCNSHYTITQCWFFIFEYLYSVQQKNLKTTTLCCLDGIWTHNFFLIREVLWPDWTTRHYSVWVGCGVRTHVLSPTVLQTVPFSHSGNPTLLYKSFSQSYLYDCAVITTSR